MNGGQVTPDLANHKWTYNVILTWDDAADAYVVTEEAYGSGDSTPTYTLTEDMIMIAVHKDESSEESIANYNLLTTAQLGQALNIYGIDVDTCSLGIAPYVSFSDGEEEPETPVDPENPDISKVDELIKYQLNNNSTDVRLVAYVDALENYLSVAFTLTIGDKVSKPLVCTTAYNGLYADGDLYITEQIPMELQKMTKKIQ